MKATLMPLPDPPAEKSCHGPFVLPNSEQTGQGRSG